MSVIVQENGRCQYQKENLDVALPQWRRVSDMMFRMTTFEAVWSKMVNMES